MKILALTSIRSDYDLLSPLYRLLDDDKEIDFRLLVSGAHLSKEFGYTKQYIEKDGFNILLEIETLINSDSLSSRLKTASIFLQNSIDIVSQYSPNVILYAGDREDVIIGALLGIYLNIPTIHFYGGDHENDGHQDTYVRHATSKLSALHFVSTENHKKRLICMGENPSSIYNIGSISLDKFNNFKKKSIQKYFKRDSFESFALVIYHPLQNEVSEKVFKNILSVLEKNNIRGIVSYPNTDPGYVEINKVINENIHNKNFIFYKNLERDLFLSLFSDCDFIIGNSSAGIHEAATIKKAAINVGFRQMDRESSENVIFCDSEKVSIDKAIKRINSIDFQTKLINMKNIYGEGNSAKKAYALIKELNVNEFIPKIYDPLKKEK
ncbi:MAG TPA: UDP-N-acetylglucosamine 2-epimerase (hydrolyzing) [Campylobacterales bacterium]|nr:UDP-N-acetylglucosamine 2-epimerase (hydrolyzing) [Campylobacterales bacterium]